MLLLHACPAFALQETAEHNVELLKQVLPPHILASLRGGSRVLVERVPQASLLQVRLLLH